MQMPTRGRAPVPLTNEIDVAPTIDVPLVLLIIVMAAIPSDGRGAARGCG